MTSLFRTGALCAIAALVVWPSAASAASAAAERAGRGIAAMGTAILELPGNIAYTDKHEGPAKAWTEGLARGIGMSIVRPPVGFYELVTAPFPGIANDPPVLQPEYPWSYFGDEGTDSSSVAER